MAAELRVFPGRKKDTPPQPPTGDLERLMVAARTLTVLDPDMLHGIVILAEHRLDELTPNGGRHQ